jgi:hypothetical protein
LTGQAQVILGNLDLLILKDISLGPLHRYEAKGSICHVAVIASALGAQPEEA